MNHGSNWHHLVPTLKFFCPLYTAAPLAPVIVTSTPSSALQRRSAVRLRHRRQEKAGYDISIAAGAEDRTGLDADVWARRREAKKEGGG